jgi:hypothetical protein
VSVQTTPESQIPVASSSSEMERPSGVQITPKNQLPAFPSSSAMVRPCVIQITPENKLPASSTPSALEGPSAERKLKVAYSSALARHSDGRGFSKPLKSLLRRGFLNSLPSVRAPSLPVSSAVSSVGLAPVGLPRPVDPSGIMTEGHWDAVLRPLCVLSYKPMQRYSRKLRGNRFLRMDDSLIVEALSSFCTPFGFSGAGENLVSPSMDLMGESRDRVDVDFEVTPRKVKGRRELKNLECSIKYVDKGTSTRRGRGKPLVF